jgi:S1-C subfamily serine protease
MVIQSVVSNSPAQKAGLKDLALDVDNEGYLTRKGDIITSAEGEKIGGFEDIVEIMKEKQPGDLLELSINRNGQIVNKTITMESMPK